MNAPALDVRSAGEFLPPPAPALMRSLGLAIIIHALLILALAWGVRWQQQSTELAFEAELWSQIPQQAAPQVVPTTPEPPAEPAAKLPPKMPDADIRLTRDKQKQQEKIEEQRREKERQEHIRRMLAQANQGSTGQASQSSTASTSYQARIRARVIPQITFPERDTVAGNPVAKVQFRIAPDGTILTPSIRIVLPSGLPAWDRAVANAIEKTQTIPRDVDGRFPDTFFELTFRVRE
jgi:colicin import membrane protein